MVYGIVSNLDTTNTLEVFHSKKINEDNIVHVNHLSNLGGILKSGDAVYVMSVNRFLRVGQVLGFGRLCMSKGVCSTKTCETILNAIATDKVKENAY